MKHVQERIRHSQAGTQGLCRVAAFSNAPIHQLCIGGELAGIAVPSYQHLPLAPLGTEQWAVSDYPDPRSISYIHECLHPVLRHH